MRTITPLLIWGGSAAETVIPESRGWRGFARPSPPRGWKRKWWVWGGLIFLASWLFVAWVNVVRDRQHADALKVETAARAVVNPANLPGTLVSCIKGSLDPICVGNRLSIVDGKYGNPVKWTVLKQTANGTITHGIAGWYLGGRACRFYYEYEPNVQCHPSEFQSPPAGQPFSCEIIKMIACE